MMNRKEFQQYLQETIKDYLPESYADASINDVSQLQFMVDKIKGYGYKNIGFILDRGIRSVWKTVHTLCMPVTQRKRQKNWQRSIKQIMNGGMAMSSYKDYKKRALQNPEVKAEYDALQPEYDIIQAMIDARVQQNMTQKDLSAKTGITQADISRIENGTRNPSLSMVKNLHRD